MRSQSPTPGCFSGLFKSRRAQAPASAPTPELKEAAPTYTHSHGLNDPCCGTAPDFSKLAVEDLPAYSEIRSVFNADARSTIRSEIFSRSEELTKISLFLSDNPEIGYKEYKAHDKITSYLKDAGFDVIPHFKLPTAFKATYTHGKGGRTFGLNSEYDALPGIGHACGHNLIAVAGIGAFLGIAAAMKKHSISGSVVLIGTPAEEGGVGKVRLLDAGGYDGLDACMMVHPTGTETKSGGIGPTLAIQGVSVEFFGKTSHAAGAPWDGVNALDAVHLVYASISALRQQLHTTDRVHGIITSGGAAPNIIPDYTSMRFYMRATTVTAVEALRKKVLAIFEAAALATGCTHKYELETMTNDLRNCKPLAEEYASTMGDLFDIPVKTIYNDWSLGGGSTDFGNVCYALPACHPHYGIPYITGRNNHTPEFTAKARSPEAHEETFKAATAVGSVGIRFLGDDKFAKESTQWWKDDMASDN